MSSQIRRPELSAAHFQGRCLRDDNQTPLWVKRQERHKLDNFKHVVVVGAIVYIISWCILLVAEQTEIVETTTGRHTVLLDVCHKPVPSFIFDPSSLWSAWPCFQLQWLTFLMSEMARIVQPENSFPPDKWDHASAPRLKQDFMISVSTVKIWL